MSVIYPVPRQPRSPPPPSGAWNTPLTTSSPDVTVALTGQGVSFSQGVLVSAVSYALTGQAGTFAQGTLTDAISYALSGQAITSAGGTVIPTIDYGLTGQAATFSQGTVSTGSDVTIALSGQAVTFSQGSLTYSLDVGLTGQAATFAQGTLTAGPSYALSGQEVTSAQGTLAPAIDTALTGQAATFSQGTMAVPGDVTIALTGQSMSFSQGTLTPSQGLILIDTHDGFKTKYKNHRQEIRAALLKVIEGPEKEEVETLVKPFVKPGRTVEFGSVDIKKLQASVDIAAKLMDMANEQDDEDAIILLLT